MVQETSLLAYKDIQKNIGERQLQVYNSIKHLKFATIRMISKDLNLPVNCITGRLNELRNKFKLVGYAYTDVCPLGHKKAMWWKIVR